MFLFRMLLIGKFYQRHLKSITVMISYCISLYFLAFVFQLKTQTEYLKIKFYYGL